MNATTKILISFGTLLLVIILGILLLSYLYWRIFLTPKDNPYEFVSGEHFHLSTKKRVVCIGDSLTHGNMSTNYVKMLGVRLGTDDYHIVNAGLNAELTYNILCKLICFRDEGLIRYSLKEQDLPTFLSKKKEGYGSHKIMPIYSNFYKHDSENLYNEMGGTRPMAI